MDRVAFQYIIQALLYPESVQKGLDLGLLHPPYLALHKFDVLGAFLALVEHASVTVQQQVRLLLLLKAFGVGADRYDGAGRRQFCA